MRGCRSRLLWALCAMLSQPRKEENRHEDEDLRCLMGGSRGSSFVLCEPRLVCLQPAHQPGACVSSLGTQRHNTDQSWRHAIISRASGGCCMGQQHSELL